MNVAELKRQGAGRWGEVLAALGIDAPPPGRHIHCPFSDHPDEHPSWRWDARKEGWFCTCGNGDALDLVQRMDGCTLPEAVKKVAALLGLNGHRATATLDDFEDLTEEPPPEREEAKGWHSCKAMWNGAIDLDVPAAAPGRAYLESRGLDASFPLPEALRCHLDLVYFVDGKETGRYPALVGLVTDGQGQPCGLQRIYLAPDGSGKAAVDPSKKAAGELKGGAVRLDEPREGKPLVIAEGIETAMAVWESIRWPTWAAVSAGGMAAVEVPAEVQEVVIAADLDRSKAGEEAAAKLAARLHAEGRAVRVVVPSDPIPEGEKSVDWLDLLNRDSRDVVREMIEAATEWEPLSGSGADDEPPRPRVSVTWFTDIQTQRLEWFWSPYLLGDALNFVSGDPGCGKSYTVQAIAAAKTAGRPFFNTNGDSPPSPGTVLYLYAEGTIDSVIVPRMDLMGVDRRRICASTGRGEDPNDYVSLDRKDLFDELIQRVQPTLLILDPIESFMGNCNPNAVDDVRPRLDYLADCCANHHVTTIGIRFDRKAAADFAIHKSAGSIAWMAAARSFLGCTEDPDRPNVNTATEKITYGIVSHIKVNDAPKGPSLRYAIHNTPSGVGQFEWTDTTHLTANDLLTARKRQAQGDNGSALERGKIFLLKALAKGPRRSEQLILDANQKGICSRGTLFQAKKELGIRAQKAGFQGEWEWEISEADLPAKYQRIDLDAILIATERDLIERAWWESGTQVVDGAPHVPMAALQAKAREARRDAQEVAEKLVAAGVIEAAGNGWRFIHGECAAELLRRRDEG